MRKIIGSNDGASAVEFALISPLLFVLLFGIIEFSAILYNQAVITNASREGARFASTYYTNPANDTAERPDCQEIRDYVALYVQAHILSFTSQNPENDINLICPNGEELPVFYDDSTSTGEKAGYYYAIQVEYPYGFLVIGNLLKLLGPGIGSSISLKAQTIMRDENQES